MARREQAQLNVRSAFARSRVDELVRQTGLTAAEIVEDALRNYVPPGKPQPVGTLVRQGPILVIPIKGKKVSLEETNDMLDAIRSRDP